MQLLLVSLIKAKLELSALISQDVQPAFGVCSDAEVQIQQK